MGPRTALDFISTTLPPFQSYWLFGSGDYIWFPFLSRNPISNLEITPILQKLLGTILYPFILIVHQGFDRRLDLRVDNFILGQARKLVKDIKNLYNDVDIIFPGLYVAVHDVISMKFDHIILDPLVLALLYTAKQLNNDPFLFRLHQCRHHLGHSMLIECFCLLAIDVLLIIFGLLLSRSLGNGDIPIIAILDTKRLEGLSG